MVKLMSRKKTKSFTQPDKEACGPASLKNALKLLGMRKSYDELYDLCKTTKNGTSVENLIKAACRLGLSVMSLEWATLTHIQNALKSAPGQPRAVIVDYLYMDEEPMEETGHYAVVASYSARSSRIILFDSFSGTKKSYLWTDFLDQWYDYDYKRIKAKHSIRRYTLYKRWHNRLMLVVAKSPKHLPKFRSVSKKLYIPNHSRSNS
jgi:ABC-type bacteriocin/lantibiotic exporter with double-glycine peptidase domain